MKIRVLGGGIYGCHIAAALLDKGHDVVLHEIADRLFSGASGNIPARLHCGAHYPRSKLTREACQAHFDRFMAQYGDFTRGVACNVYAVADNSLLDFGTYAQLMRAEIPCIPVYRPEELGIRGVEGAILTGERHIIVDQLREHFAIRLDSVIAFNQPPSVVDDDRWDATIDATFCAHEAASIDRYEVCLTVLLRGPMNFALTIMDGKFPSVYPWDEERGLSSLTSARHTVLHTAYSYEDAASWRDKFSGGGAVDNAAILMRGQMNEFYPAILRDYEHVDNRIAIRAMPSSKADARLIDVIRTGDRGIRIRAGKLDAVFAAETSIEAYLDIIADERK